MENASEPKRQKREENKDDDDDESVTIIERLKSLREDLSNCFNKWKELDYEQKMENVDVVFNKVDARLDDVYNKVHAINLKFNLPSEITQLFLEDFVREYNQLMELAGLLCEERRALLLAHREKSMGREFDIRLLKLYKMEEKTEEVLNDERWGTPNDRYICSLLRDLPHEYILDEYELAVDDNEEADYDVIWEEMVGMINCYDKGSEVCLRFTNFIFSLHVKTHNMGGLMISKMERGGCGSKDRMISKMGRDGSKKRSAAFYL